MKLFLILLVLTTPQAWATRVEGESHALLDAPCSAQQQQQNTVAEKAVLLRLSALEAQWPLLDLVGVRRDFVIPEARQWVEGSPQHQRYQDYWQSVRRTFQLMHQSARQGLTLECRDQRDRDCRGMEVLAYVRFVFGRPQRTIYLCPAFYATNGEAQAETLLHELSHSAAGTHDHALDWWRRSQSDLARAAQDAYHLQLFMHEEASRVLWRQIWVWWWPK